MIRDGKFPLVGNGRNRRSMAYTETLADGLVRAALAEAARGQTYWMADRRPYTMLEIVETVEGLLRTEFGQRCRGRYPRLPGFIGDAARIIDAATQRLGFYSPEIHVLSEMNLAIACSIDKASRELGYAPSIELEEGMRRSLNWLFEARGGL
jgi:nucleoside-diphosphate-sugar epimerase